MKVKLNKNQLWNGLQLVQNVVGTRTTLPILSNVLLQATDQSLQLTTTDLDLAVRSKVKAEVIKTGSCTVPVRRFAALVRELPEKEVAIEVDSKNMVSIKCGHSSFKIHGLPAEEFPSLPVFEKKKKISIPQSTLKEILQRTTFAISTDESRYVLNGILMSFKENKMMAVATDGRRLALVETEKEIPKNSEQDVIVPTKAVGELARILGSEGVVEMEISDSQISFEFLRPKNEKKGKNDGAEEESPTNDGALLISKQIVGNFPNFRQVIPAESKERVSLHRETFLHSLLRASLLTSEKSSSVKLAFAKNELTISANTPDVGESKETMEIKYEGKEFAIAFNPEFLMQPLRNLDTDEIYFELTDELSPGVMKINGAFLYVVMPLRLN